MNTAIQFGMPTLLEIKSPEVCAALCRKLGLKFIELNMNLPEYQVERMDAAQLAGIAERYGIFYTMHFDDYNTPCDFNDKIAAAYTETVLQTIEIAKRLGMPVLNMHLHSGTFFTLPDRKVFLFEEYADEYMKKLTVFRDVCTAAVGDADIKICVENCGDFGTRPYIRKSLELLLESPAFAMTFDIGHNAAGDYSDEPTYGTYKQTAPHAHP